MAAALSPLLAVSPLDGRYWTQVAPLSDFFSEFSLIKYRVRVEIEYFIALCELPLPELTSFNDNNDKEERYRILRDIYNKFTIGDAEKIKATERITNHDVKAVEYFLKEKFDANGWKQYKEFIHFALTSQDINNTAIPLALKDFIDSSFINDMNNLIDVFKKRGQEWREVPMLARTHGQPATPTTVGKEIWVFVERIEGQLQLLKSIPIAAKFGGATGNLNAHYITYPNFDWISFSNSFVNQKLGLKRMQFTTQIEHYDNLAALLDNVKRINTILLDLAKDMWTYISLEYFTQRVEKNEVGSSTMPHKVNPIDFENAEGNLGIANAIFEHMSSKLPISRMQRDLTDSTVLRNLGVPFGHTVIAFKSLTKGMGKLSLNINKVNSDLEDNWPVVAEALQTILRRENFPEPYEALKALTRVDKEKGKITKETFVTFINGLQVEERVKHELLLVSPFSYVGKVPQF